MKKSLLLLSFFARAAAILAAENNVTVYPDAAEIVLPRTANMVARAAAGELQAHLRLVTGKSLPVVAEPTAGKFIFSFPGVPAGISLKPEQAHYEIFDHAVVFYGNDHESFSAPKDDITKVMTSREAAGTLTAVYAFLEDSFGIRWVWPGESGVSYPSLDVLALQMGAKDWTPTLIMREIRAGYSHRSVDAVETTNELYPAELAETRQSMTQKWLDTATWLRRMRMGCSYRPSFGHAFTRWWDKYHEEHPDFFAMQKNGVRDLDSYYKKSPERIKLCVSNPDVVKMVVKEWLDSGKPFSINTCENDSAGFCLCSKCLALDAPLQGEKPLEHLTDRYVHFTNAVRREAAKYRPDVIATIYGYGCYVKPPRKEHVDPNVLIGMVPAMLTDFDTTEKTYSDWQAAGATAIFLRPNDHHVNPGIPMGFEKRMYEHFQVGVRHGIIGTDYDSLHNLWQVNGISDYILARAIAAPQRSFEDILDEYCGAFGDAAQDVRKYFDYWRCEVFDKRLMPQAKIIVEKGRYGNFRRGLMWNLQDYYSMADFDTTNAYLAAAAGRMLTPPQKSLVNALQLANEHARMMYMAIASTGVERMKQGVKILKFRSEHKNDLRWNWQMLMKIEYEAGDICGIKTARMLGEFSDMASTPTYWAFAMDKENTGETQNWPQMKAGELKKLWNNQEICVGTQWERQSPQTIGKDLAETLKNYDGIGWYAQKMHVKPEWKGQRVFMVFGIVDESIWLWINGILAGQRVYSGGEEWKEPVVIEITNCIDWNKPTVHAVAKVRDSNGMGGISKNVYLTTK